MIWGCVFCFVVVFAISSTSMRLDEVKKQQKLALGGSGMANFLPVFTALGLGPSSVPSMTSLSATTIPT